MTTDRDLLARFEALVADCFHRPLLVTLCRRFAREARARGDGGLLLYTGAKRALQEARLADTASLASTRLYGDLIRLARSFGDGLLESIARTKYASAASQAFRRRGRELYAGDVRAALEDVLALPLPDVGALRDFKLAEFAAAFNLARGADLDSVESTLELAARVPLASLVEDPQPVDSGQGPEQGPSLTARVLLHAATGLANELEEELGTAHAILLNILRVDGGFLAVRLSAFHNRLAHLCLSGDRAALDEMEEHVVACLEGTRTQAALRTRFDDELEAEILAAPLDELAERVHALKAPFIRDYAERLSVELEKTREGRQGASELAGFCARYRYPAIDSRHDAAGYSFECRVENAWRARVESALAVPAS